MKEYMLEVISIEDFHNYAKLENKSVFVFSANWCPDCVFLNGFIKEIIEEYTKKGFTFYYVDRDKNIDLCQELMIMGIPSFVVFRNGKEISRLVSKLRKTKKEIELFLDKIK